MCNHEISSRRIDWFFREALQPSGADRRGGGRTNPPSTGEGGEIRKTGEGTISDLGSREDSLRSFWKRPSQTSIGTRFLRPLRSLG